MVQVDLFIPDRYSFQYQWKIPAFLGSPQKCLPGAAAQVVKSRGKQDTAVHAENESPEGDITSSSGKRSKEDSEDAVNSPWSIDIS